MAPGQRVGVAYSCADARCPGVLESPTAPKLPSVHYAHQSNSIDLPETFPIHQSEPLLCVHNFSENRAVYVD